MRLFFFLPPPLLNGAKRPATIKRTLLVTSGSATLIRNIIVRASEGAGQSLFLGRMSINIPTARDLQRKAIGPGKDPHRPSRKTHL